MERSHELSDAELDPGSDFHIETEPPKEAMPFGAAWEEIPVKGAVHMPKH